MWNESQLAYMAGIIDGEGTISIFASTNSTKGKSYPCYCPRVNAYNCDERLMIWLVQNFGGKSRPVKRGRNSNPKWRQSYIWEVSRREATVILQAILPYLVIKKAQAELFLEFRKTTPSRNIRGVLGLAPEAVQKRTEIMDQIKFLNRRGARALDSEGCEKTYTESQVC